MLPGDDVLASQRSNAGMNILKYLRSIAWGALRGFDVQQLFQSGVSKSGLSASSIECEWRLDRVGELQDDPLVIYS
jgi:hypothetical protein